MKRLVALGLMTAALTLQGSSEACMREMAVHGDPAAMNPAAEVAKSDTILESGTNHASVLSTLAKPFPTLRLAQPSAKEPLQNHALRNAALALGRSNGALSLAGFKASDASTNLLWASNTLRGLLALRPTDASLEADLAEVLARNPATKDEAFKRLTALAQKDIIGSPQALETLSSLRREKGDAEGAKEAHDKCLSMASAPAACSVVTKKPAPAAPPAAVPNAVAATRS